MSHINVRGVNLETTYLPGPTGPSPLVFLHEGLGSVSMWSQRGRHWPAELCAATGRAGWLYSRRGYGQSDPVPDVRGPSARSGAWSVGRHLPDYMHREAFEVLPAWLAATGIQRPVLIGHSDGATIALLHASRYPVSACVAMAPHVFVESKALAAIEQARQLYSANDGGFRQRLSRHHKDPDNAFWQWNDVWLSEPFRSFDIQADCAPIASPLLCVQGLDDEYGTLGQLDAIQAVVPRCRRLEIAQCGHSPHRDQPEQLSTAIADFLKTCD
ncbi:alpha/beta hydrolase [Hydrogenophaga crassostreae]|uniref:Alpha/beta hydrolase n=1 Tax=Hydrogenophaga crassostreae TaxID=1763535 RepID=A0A167H2K1_9BURK|nr:alpha/beta hydrolase [Hydrogenophaga crassostreae]AOW12998.1 alpha/beta hydrolase [Hydrogenophaga crassostreae]OAD40179.1 alpha/beta hydrolase [Hydrogenophaga crassostreae]